jgi:hypothetical protein
MRKRLTKAVAGSMLAGTLVVGGAGMASAGGGGCFHETPPSVGRTRPST